MLTRVLRNPAISNFLMFVLWYMKSGYCSQRGTCVRCVGHLWLRFYRGSPYKPQTALCCPGHAGTTSPPPSSPGECPCSWSAAGSGACPRTGRRGLGSCCRWPHQTWLEARRRTGKTVWAASRTTSPGSSWTISGSRRWGSAEPGEDKVATRPSGNKVVYRRGDDGSDARRNGGMRNGRNNNIALFIIKTRHFLSKLSCCPSCLFMTSRQQQPLCFCLFVWSFCWFVLCPATHHENGCKLLGVWWRWRNNVRKPCEHPWGPAWTGPGVTTTTTTTTTTKHLTHFRPELQIWQRYEFRLTQRNPLWNISSSALAFKVFCFFLVSWRIALGVGHEALDHFIEIKRTYKTAKNKGTDSNPCPPLVRGSTTATTSKLTAASLVRRITLSKKRQRRASTTTTTTTTTTKHTHNAMSNCDVIHHHWPKMNRPKVTTKAVLIWKIVSVDPQKHGVVFEVLKSHFLVVNVKWRRHPEWQETVGRDTSRGDQTLRVFCTYYLCLGCVSRTWGHLTCAYRH